MVSWARHWVEGGATQADPTLDLVLEEVVHRIQQQLSAVACWRVAQHFFESGVLPWAWAWAWAFFLALHGD